MTIKKMNIVFSLEDSEIDTLVETAKAARDMKYDLEKSLSEEEYNHTCADNIQFYLTEIYNDIYDFLTFMDVNTKGYGLF